MVWIPTKIEHVEDQDDLLGMLQAMLMDHNLMVKKKSIQAAEHKVAGWIYPSHDAMDVERWQAVFQQVCLRYADGILEQNERVLDLQVVFHSRE